MKENMVLSALCPPSLSLSLLEQLHSPAAPQLRKLSETGALLSFKLQSDSAAAAAAVLRFTLFAPPLFSHTATSHYCSLTRPLPV